MLTRRGEQRIHLITHGDVRGYRENAVGTELGFDRPRRGLTAVVVHDHPRSLFQERSGDRGAQSAGTARHEHDLIGERQRTHLDIPPPA